VQRIVTNVKGIEKGFHEMKGFPGVVGAIDGSHIEIKMPSVSGESYVNRKGFPSVLLQAVVDCNRRFTDCLVGWPGSVHDARVFSNSKIGITMNECPMDMFPNDTHILGDSAYPLLPHMLTPYKDTGNLSDTQVNYNFIHSATRNVVERAFGCMKSKFRRLEKVELNNLEDICNVIMSTCVLHNFCIDENEYDDQQETEPDASNRDRYICIGSSRPDAESKRERIANSLI